MPAVRVFIGRDGKIVVEGIGYADDRCLADLEKLMDALKRYGVEARIEMQQLKPEASIKAREEVAARG